MLILEQKPMIHYEEIKCPICEGNQIRKNGHSENGTQRWLCLNEDCPKRSFQLSYTYNANKPGVKEQIDNLTVNSSGVRDIARTLSINKNTVISHLKKRKSKK